MNQNQLDWALCRSFLAVLREGSLSGAARALDVAQPTIGRHVEALEQILVTRLFLRSNSGLTPTEAALNLRSSAETMEAAAAAFARAASADADDPHGTVRIAASEIMGAEALPPILTQLRRRYPRLSFEVMLSNATQDLLRHEADIAVRMIRPTQPRLIARKVADLPMGFYAHRDWVAVYGEPVSFAWLTEAAALIGYDRDPSMIRAARGLGIILSPAAFGFRADSDLAQLAAIRAGFGVGICQTALAARDPRLSRLLPELGLVLEAWLVTHPDLIDLRRIRVTIDALAEGLKEWAHPVTSA